MRKWRSCLGTSWTVRWRSLASTPSATLHRHPHRYAHALCSTLQSQNRHPHTPGRSGLGSHVVRQTTDFSTSFDAMVSVEPGAAPNLQPGRRGVGFLVETGTTGRTSCGTPEPHRPSYHLPRYATAHRAARTIFHNPRLLLASHARLMVVRAW